MRPAENINELIKKLQLKASADLDRRVHEDISRALTEPKKTESAPPEPNIWRIIMKSPITKLATAAVVIIACVIGLSLWRTTGSGIALADVLARVEKVKAYRYKSSLKITNPYNFEQRTTTLASQEYGLKENGEQHLDPNIVLTHETYFLPKKKIRLSIVPKEKKCLLTELDDTQVERQQKQLRGENSPNKYLTEIQKYKYESLGRSTMDGIEVTGFRSTDPNMFDVKLWVDVKTLLPVRYEYEHFRQMGNNTKDHTRIVSYDYQWDVPIDASEFEPVIPDDYIVITDPKTPTATEETAIQGLKVYADLSGDYPDTLVWIALEGLVDRIKENVKGLTEEEKAKRLRDIAQGLHETRRFGHAKRARYYGKTVTPKDADKVLMRWKVSDSEYRVIYGDLLAETVTKEKLAELEAALPK